VATSVENMTTSLNLEPKSIEKVDNDKATDRQDIQLDSPQKVQV